MAKVVECLVCGGTGRVWDDDPISVQYGISTKPIHMPCPECDRAGTVALTEDVATAYVEHYAYALGGAIVDGDEYIVAHVGGQIKTAAATVAPYAADDFAALLAQARDAWRCINAGGHFVGR